MSSYLRDQLESILGPTTCRTTIVTYSITFLPLLLYHIFLIHFWISYPMINSAIDTNVSLCPFPQTLSLKLINKHPFKSVGHMLWFLSCLLSRITILGFSPISLMVKPQLGANRSIGLNTRQMVLLSITKLVCWLRVIHNKKELITSTLSLLWLS